MSAILKLLGPFGIAGATLSVALSILLGLQVHKTHTATDYGRAQHQLYTDEQLAHQRTINNYRAASEQARQEDAANVQRVKAEQAAINERTQNEYEARLADARARADSLRGQLAKAAAHPGSRPAAGVSGAVGPSGSPDGSATQDGFSVSDRLIATEQAIQLDELIKWLQKNLRVDYSGQMTADQVVHPRPGSSSSSPNANH